MPLYIGDEKISQVSIGGSGGGEVNLQEKTATPTENIQVIQPDSFYNGLSRVIVNPIDPEYIGSQIPIGSASGLTVLTDTEESVTFGSGYYPNSHGAQVLTVSVPNPSMTFDNTTGVITASGSWTKGYTENNSYSATYTVPVINAPTVTLSESSQILTTSGKYVNGNITIPAISSSYIGSSIERLSASTWTPGRYAQTISAGQYLLGEQTISGDNNLTAENIKSGISIFGVLGNYVGSTSGGTEDATATASDIAYGKTAYITSGKVTGQMTERQSSDVTVSANTVTIPSGHYSTQVQKTISTVEHPDPVITVNSGTGLITASHTQQQGYAVGGTTSKTQQLSIKSAETITPSTTSQIIPSGVYLTGDQTITGDLNLLPENIKTGVSIFGVNGSYSGSGGSDTSDATAYSTDILSGKTAYARGAKLTGTIESKSASDLSASGDSVIVPAGYYANQVSKSIEHVELGTPYFSSIEYGSGNVTIRFTVNQASGGYVEAGSKTGTRTYSSVSSTTYTPGTSDSTIISASTTNLKICIGNQVIKGDANLVAGNIKSGVSIFGVTGTYSGGGGGVDPSDATAIASDILTGKTAYTGAGKITGTISKKSAATYTPGTSDQTISAGQYLNGIQTIKGDANLIASNIKSGVTIFGVTGTYEGDIPDMIGQRGKLLSTDGTQTMWVDFNDAETLTPSSSTFDLEYENFGKFYRIESSLSTLMPTFKSKYLGLCDVIIHNTGSSDMTIGNGGFKYYTGSSYENITAILPDTAITIGAGKYREMSVRYIETGDTASPYQAIVLASPEMSIPTA